MASRQEMLIEANNRGLLTGEKKAQFDEAVSRGLITLPTDQLPDEQLQQVKVPQQGITRQQLLEMQRTVQYPGEETTLGAMGAGFVRGMERVGEGMTQRGLDVYEFFGGDASEFRGELELSRQIQEQRAKPTEEEFPIATTVGEIGGSIAAVPIPAATIPKAAAAGGAFGATQYLEQGEGLGTFAKNIAVDAALGALGAAAAPYIQLGFNKAQSLFSGIYKRATGADPRPEMFTIDGQLSDEGKRALSDLGMTEDEFSRIYQTLDQDLNPVQAARQARAEEAGIDLTTGQVTRDFPTQEAEQTLRSGLGREAEAARAAEAAQQEQIRGATERLVGDIADVSEGRAVTGGRVQEALRDIQKEGRKEVSALYTQAKETPGSYEPLAYDDLLDAIDEEVISRPIDDATASKLESLMGKFGLIDGEVSKAGRFNQVIDAEGNKVKFKGDQELLSLDNAEEFRQGLNKLLPNDQSGAISQIIQKLDSTVDESIEGLAGEAPKTLAFKAARKAARQEAMKFKQKDIVNKLVDYKKGTSTDMLDPSVVMDRIYKGKEGLTNLKQVKSALMSKPNNKSVDAWKSIQAQGVADVFSDSINPVTGEISGQRMASAIKRLGSGKTAEGERKLKVLLGDKYKEFDNLVKAIGDATIPVKGTTNPSGTAYKLINFMQRMGNVGEFGTDAVLTMGQKAKDAAKSKSVLRRIETASPERVQQAVKANDEMIDAFLQLGLSRSAQTQ